MPATLLVKDLSPKFLAFYEKAQGADPETRWALWKQHYDFAAVPPTEEGYRLARQMLDESFHRYPEVLDLIRAGATGYRPALEPVLEATCRAMEFDQEMTVEVVFYVGMLEYNAFAAQFNDRYVVNLPLDWPMEKTPFLLAHELAHVLHFKLSQAAGGWLRSIGRSVMEEGIAIWTSRAVFPGHSEYRYVADHKPGWLEQCRSVDRAILAGIRPALTDSSNEALMTYIFGPGPGGLDREVYYAGYRAVGHLLEKGYSLGQLAHLTESEFIPVLDRAIEELLV